MAIQGLQSTDDQALDAAGASQIGSPDLIPGTERPTNWRQGILMRFPNGHAPLVALTSVMKKKVTDDPQFQWWERELSDVRIEIGTAVADGVATTIVIVDGTFGGGLQTKVGDILYAEQTGELMKVVGPTPASATSVEVVRGYGGTTAAAIPIALAGENPNLLIVGSVYAEGADTPESVRYRATKLFNYTQIFRDSLKASRTAIHTRLRTVDEIRDAKQQTLLYHSIRMEYGFIFGEKDEILSGGEPERMTGGIISHIDPANIRDQAGVAYEMTDFEDDMLAAFRFGSQEKIGFCGNRAMLGIQQMARTNASLEITPATKEFGMDVRRLFTPSGTVVLKTHPLFNQVQSDVSAVTPGPYFSLDSWLMIVDMANLTYRPLRNSDTQYLPDRQSNGADALTSEYLTEAGLEIAHGKTHYLIKGIVSGAVDGTAP